MQSEKNLARKISLISTSVFALFLICFVFFTRAFLIYRERVILQNIDATPIIGLVISHPGIGILDSNTHSQSISDMRSDAGIVFESLRDSIVIQPGQGIIKNGIFHFTDISREDFIGKPEYFSEGIEDKVFLFRKIEEKEIRLYISRDITNIELLVTNLITLSVGVIILFLIVIYCLSQFFARLTMSPIHKNNLLLREFNHSLAHEIKTPLSVIRLNLETLETKISSQLILSAIEEVDTISSITDAMLFISEGTILRESEEHKFSDYIRSFVDRHHHGRLEIIGSSDYTTQVTSILFDRILTNLCENALKYGQSKPVIRISNNTFSIENTTKKDIDNDSLGKLGTPFFQVHTENRKIGNGLGLSIVRRITELLGWGIVYTYEDKLFKVTIEILVIDTKDEIRI